MDTLDTATFKKLADKLQRLTECPVCLGSLRPPVTLCVNGHGVCPSCKVLLTECPLCRSPFSAQKSPLALNQLLEALPKRCRYDGSGCPAMSTEEDHEQYCGYRPTPCRVLGCAWRGPVHSLESHLRVAHGRPQTLVSNSNHYLTLPGFQPDRELKVFTPMVFNGDILWQVTRLDRAKRKLFITFFRLPVGPPRGGMFAVITLSGPRIPPSNHFEFSHPLDQSQEDLYDSWTPGQGESIQYTYSVKVSNRDEGDADISCLDYVMSVPQCVLLKLMPHDGNLTSVLRIIKE